jgi:hypothetical protein
MRFAIMRHDGVQSRIFIAEPQTPLERYNKQPPNTVAMDPLDGAVVVNLVTTAATLWNSSISSGFQSNPVKVTVSSLACVETPCRAQITFQHHKHLVNMTDQVNNRTQVMVSCAKGIVDIQNITCPDGQVTSYNCSGRAETVTIRCPGVLTRPSCAVLSDEIAAPGSELCKMVTYDASQTVCSCEVQAASGRRRKLDGTDNLVGTIQEEAASIQVVIMMESVGTGFVETISKADETNLSIITDSKLVLGMCAMMWSVAFLCALNQFMPSCDSVVPHPQISQRVGSLIPSKVSSAFLSSSRSNERNGDDAAITSKKTFFVDYINSVIPAIFRVNGVAALWSEMRTHHRYVSIVCASSSKHRTRKALQLLCLQNYLVFIMSLTYNLEVRKNYHFNIILCIYMEIIFSFSMINLCPVS